MQLEPGKRFSLLARARDPQALVMAERALKRGGSLSAAVEILGTSTMTMHRVALAWPKLRKVLDAGKMTPAEASALGVVAAQRARKSRKRAGA